MITLLNQISNGVPGLVNGLFRSPSMPTLSHTKVTHYSRNGISPYASISVKELVDEVGPLPRGSILVGACDDQQHFYMDLFDPRPGSVLIAAEGGGGMTQLLHSILSSSGVFNSHRSLRYAILSSEPTRSQHILKSAHCFRSHSTNSLGAGQLITYLADLAESRSYPCHAEPMLILAIDGLDSLCTQLDDRAYDDLAWLLQYGPMMHVWPFATLNMKRAHLVGTEMIDLFGTQLLGKMNGKYASIFQGDDDVISHLIPKKQFCVLHENEWMRFWVPEPDEGERMLSNIFEVL